MKQLLTVLLTLALASSAVAQVQLSWIKLLDQSEGSLHGIIGEDTVFALRDTRISRSVDGGITWEVTGTLPSWRQLDEANRRVRESPTQHVWIDGDHGVYYTEVSDDNQSCACTFAGKYVTTNAGESWTTTQTEHEWPVSWLRYSDGLLATANMPGYQDGSIPVAGKLLASRTATQWDFNFDRSLELLDLSTDGLLYFRFADTLFLYDLVSGELRSSAISPFSPTFVGLESFLVTNTTPVHLSHDNGASWKDLFFPSGLRYATNRRCVIYAHDASNAMRSIDCGISWVEVQGGHPYGNWFVVNDSVIYASTTNGLYRTVTSNLKLDASDRVQQDRVKIYPNPTSDFVTLSNAGYWFDLLGRSYDVPSESLDDEYRYDVRGLNAGVYIVRYEGGSQMVVVQ